MSTYSLFWVSNFSIRIRNWSFYRQLFLCKYLLPNHNSRDCILILHVAFLEQIHSESHNTYLSRNISLMLVAFRFIYFTYIFFCHYWWWVFRSFIFCIFLRGISYLFSVMGLSTAIHSNIHGRVTTRKKKQFFFLKQRLQDLLQINVLPEIYTLFRELTSGVELRKTLS